MNIICLIVLFVLCNCFVMCDSMKVLNEKFVSMSGRFVYVGCVCMCVSIVRRLLVLFVLLLCMFLVVLMLWKFDW